MEKNFKAKFNNTSLTSFSKKTCFKILKRALVINKNVFQIKFYSITHQSVISQLTRDVFHGKTSEVIHFMSLLFLLF